jgi:hypothetical protein
VAALNDLSEAHVMAESAEEILNKFKPIYTATILAESTPSFSVDTLVRQIQDLAPFLAVSKLADSFEFNSDVNGLMTGLTIDNHVIGCIQRNTPVHASSFDVGGLDNLIVIDPQREFAAHTHHMSVFATQNPEPKIDRIHAARIVTIVSAAVMKLHEVIAIKWEDAKNFMTVSSFWDSCRDSLSATALPIPFLVRLSTLRGTLKQGGPVVQLMCTNGLPLFGLRDIELYLSKTSIETGSMLAYSIAQAMLMRDADYVSGGSMTFEGQTFRVELQKEGRISSWPTIDVLDEELWAATI